MSGFQRYLIFYRVLSGRIQIWRVLHGTRDLSQVLGQRAGEIGCGHGGRRRGQQGIRHSRHRLQRRQRGLGGRAVVGAHANLQPAGRAVEDRRAEVERDVEQSAAHRERYVFSAGLLTESWRVNHAEKILWDFRALPLVPMIHPP